MAETFLLLVFCLLLVAAAAISSAIAERDRIAEEAATMRDELARIRQERDHLRKENSALVEANAKLEQTIATLPPDIVRRSTIDDDWRELTLAKELADTVDAADLSPEEVIELTPAMTILKEKGFLKPQDNSPAERLDAMLSAAEEAQQPHRWPPIINLSEADRYNFTVGSAELTTAFREQLRDDIVAQIVDFLEQYSADVVEVVGHTDEQPLAGPSSNLDQTIGRILAGRATASDITPADNAGLGFARAIAVANVLRSDRRLTNATILPLSAAQLILPGDVMTDGTHGGDVKERRRIEIRIRRRSDRVIDGG